MYNAKFVGENGVVFNFGAENGVVFDIDPISEIDIDISTAQGYNQVGDTIDTQAIHGITRTISGVIVGEANLKKKAMLSAFSPNNRGKLIFNDKYYCECVVKKTPAFHPRTRDAKFTLMVYCPYPYWNDVTDSVVQANIYEKAFMFPTSYDDHVFGIKDTSGFSIATNNGNVSTYYSVVFTALDTVTNYGLLNVTTEQTLKINDTLEAGEVVTVYRAHDRIYAEKNTSNTITDMIFKFDENNDFYSLAVGNNIIKLTADSGTDNLSALITYNNAYTGVYDGM